MGSVPPKLETGNGKVRMQLKGGTHLQQDRLFGNLTTTLSYFYKIWDRLSTNIIAISSYFIFFVSPPHFKLPKSCLRYPQFLFFSNLISLFFFLPIWFLNFYASSCLILPSSFTMFLLFFFFSGWNQYLTNFIPTVE